MESLGEGSWSLAELHVEPLGGAQLDPDGVVHGVPGGVHLDPGVAVCGVPGGVQPEPAGAVHGVPGGKHSWSLMTQYRESLGEMEQFFREVLVPH